MVYVYECPECWRREERRRSVEQRDAPAICTACFQFACDVAEIVDDARLSEVVLMQRVNDWSGLQICTQREVDRPENKYALGFSAEDKLAAVKRDVSLMERQEAKIAAKKAEGLIPEFASAPDYTMMDAVQEAKATPKAEREHFVREMQAEAA